jgi:two-component system, cell cycle sensor histidine kinase and response regulator CckA
MQTRSLVLLVEDEAPVRSFAARALQLQGHRVLEAESGEAALALLADPALRPDLFVTDVIMPGLDGPGWVAQVRDRYPTTPVVFMSGYAEDGRSAAQARVENSVFLAKPFSLGDFTATVSAQLKRQTDTV